MSSMAEEHTVQESSRAEYMRSAGIPASIKEKIISAKRVVIKLGTNSLMGQFEDKIEESAEKSTEKSTEESTEESAEKSTEESTEAQGGDLACRTRTPLGMQIERSTQTLRASKGINVKLLDSLILQIVNFKLEKEIILVTSGSIGLGAKELGEPLPITEIPLRQACAAVGQPLLMQEYKKIFQNYQSHCAQLLLTGNDFNSELSYTALKNCLELLMSRKVVPIINENDSVSIDEIGLAFGDNDSLSARVATKIGADMLILLTDVDALYDKNPKKNYDAKKIAFVDDIGAHMRHIDNQKSEDNGGSSFGTGGIRTKIRAAQLASAANCVTVIALAHAPNVLSDIFGGKEVGSVLV